MAEEIKNQTTATNNTSNPPADELGSVVSPIQISSPIIPSIAPTAPATALPASPIIPIQPPITAPIIPPIAPTTTPVSPSAPAPEILKSVSQQLKDLEEADKKSLAENPPIIQPVAPEAMKPISQQLRELEDSDKGFSAEKPPVGFAPEPAAKIVTPTTPATPVIKAATPPTPAAQAGRAVPVSVAGEAAPAPQTPPSVTPVTTPSPIIPPVAPIIAPLSPIPPITPKPPVAPAPIIQTPPTATFNFAAAPTPAAAQKTPLAPFGFAPASTPPNNAVTGAAPKAPNEIASVRTFRGDISEYTSKSKSSYFDIVAQSAKKRSLDLDDGSSALPRNTKIIIGAVAGILLLLAGAGIYLLFSRSQQTTVQENITRAPQPLIFADYEKVFNYSGDKQKLLDTIQSSLAIPLLSGEFTYIPIKVTGTVNEYFAGPKDLLGIAGANAPAELLSQMSEPFTFGYIDAYGQNEIVMIFKINEYDRSFASLLSWENSMTRDLGSLLPRTASLNLGDNKFKDVVVKNHDARVLTNLENKPVLAYTIFNRKLVVFTSSKLALEIILSRLIDSPPNI